MKLSHSLDDCCVYLCFRSDQIRDWISDQRSFLKRNSKVKIVDLHWSWVNVEFRVLLKVFFFFVSCIKADYRVKIRSTTRKAEQCANWLKHSQLFLLSFFIFIVFFVNYRVLVCFVFGCDGRTCLLCCSLGRCRGVTDCLELVAAGCRKETSAYRAYKAKALLTQVPSG